MAKASFRTRPHELYDFVVGFKVWLPAQLVAIVIAGVAVPVLGDAAMGLMVGAVASVVALFYAYFRFRPAMEKAAEGLPRIELDGEQLSVPMGRGKTSVYYKNDSLLMEAGHYNRANVTQGGTSMGTWIRLEQGDQKVLLVADGLPDGGPQGMPRAHLPQGQGLPMVFMFPEEVVQLYLKLV